MANPGKPLDWSDDDLDALSEITPADVLSADAYVARFGSPLLQALYGAASYEPPEDGA